MKAMIAASGLLAFTPGQFQAPRPPEQFLGNPPEAVAIFYADPATVDSVCRGLIDRAGDPNRRVPSNWTVYACTNTAARSSLMPDPCGPQYAGEAYAALACHEKGHANGWGWEYS